MPAIARIFVPLLLALVVGCDNAAKPMTFSASSAPAAIGQPVSTTRPIVRAADRLDVMEAVFRHQFNNNGSGGQRNVDYFFLSLDGRADPPAELLARFGGAKPTVLPVSLAKESAGDVGHRELGGKGIIFCVVSVAWLDENTAEAEGGYYENGLSASGNTYRVTRANGVWKVTSDQMHWIS